MSSPIIEQEFHTRIIKLLGEGDFATVSAMATANNANTTALKNLIEKGNQEPNNIIRDMLRGLKNENYKQAIELIKQLERLGANANTPISSNNLFTYALYMNSTNHLLKTQFLLDIGTSLTFNNKQNLSALSYCYMPSKPPEVEPEVKNLILKKFSEQVEGWTEKELKEYLENIKKSKNFAGLDAVLKIKKESSSALNEFMTEFKKNTKPYFEHAIKNDMISLLDSFYEEHKADIIFLREPYILRTFLRGDYSTLSEFITSNKTDAEILRNFIKKDDYSHRFIIANLITNIKEYNLTQAVILTKQLQSMGLNLNIPFGTSDTKNILTSEMETLNQSTNPITRIRFLLEIGADLALTDRNNRSALSYCYKPPDFLPDILPECVNMMVKKFSEQVEGWTEKELKKYLENARNSKNLAGLDIVLKIKKNKSDILSQFIDEFLKNPQPYLQHAIDDEMAGLVEFLLNEYKNDVTLFYEKSPIGTDAFTATLRFLFTDPLVAENKSIDFVFDLLQNSNNKDKLGYTTSKYISDIDYQQHKNNRNKKTLQEKFSEKLKSISDAELTNYLISCATGNLIGLEFLLENPETKDRVITILNNQLFNGKTLLYHVVYFTVVKDKVSLFTKLMKSGLDKNLLGEMTKIWTTEEISTQIYQQFKNEADHFGITPLVWLASRNQWEILKRLVKELGNAKPSPELLNPNLPDYFGNLPLMVAIKNKSQEYIKTLLDPPLSADPNLADSKGELPLQTAIRIAKDININKILLDHGAPLLKPDAKGFWPIHEARKLGNKEILEQIQKATIQKMNNTLKALLNQKQGTELTKRTIKLHSLELIRKYLDGTPLPTRAEWLASGGEDAQYTFMIDTIPVTQKIDDTSDTDLKRIIHAEPPNSTIEEFFQIIHQITREQITQKVNLVEFEKKCLNNLKKDENKKIYLEQKQFIAFGNFLNIYSQSKNNAKKEAKKFLDRNGYSNKEFFVNLLIQFGEGMITPKSIFLLEVLAKSIFGDNWSSSVYNITKNSDELMNYLFELGMNFERQDRHSMSVLNYAVSLGNINYIKAFLNKLSPASTKDFYNSQHVPCPIAAAIRNAHPEIVKLFLEGGASPIYGFNPASQKTLLELAGNNPVMIEIIKTYILKKEAEEKTIVLSTTLVAPKEPSTNETKKQKTNLVTEKQIDLGRRLAHTLGITKIKTGITTEKPSEINVESAFNEQSVSWLLQVLQDYRKKGIKSEEGNLAFTKIQNALRLYQEVMEYKKTREELIKSYETGNLVMIPTTWWGHATSVVLKKVNNETLLSFTNRGEGGDQKFGTKIYKIRPEVNIKLLIKKLLVDPRAAVQNHFLTSDESQSYLENCIKDSVELTIEDAKPKVFDALNQKGQKRGTCGFANRKAAIQAALYFLDYETLSQKHPENTDEQQKHAANQHSKKAYKHFTNAMRDNELDNLFQELEQAKLENADLNFYYEVLVAIILEHSDFNKKLDVDTPEKRLKRMGQGQRIIKIWTELPAEYQALIVKQIPDFKLLISEFQAEILKARENEAAKALADTTAENAAKAKANILKEEAEPGKALKDTVKDEKTTDSIKTELSEVQQQFKTLKEKPQNTLAGSTAETASEITKQKDLSKKISEPAPTSKPKTGESDTKGSKPKH